MTIQFAFDLRLARRKAGLTQGDCAQLLGVHQSRVSEFEKGSQIPTIEELCLLAVSLDRKFDGLFADELDRARELLKQRVKTLPKTRRRTAATFNRDHTLKRLDRTLNAKTDNHE